MKSLSRVRLLVTPWTAANQAPPSMGFSRLEYSILKYKYISQDSLLTNISFIMRAVFFVGFMVSSAVTTLLSRTGLSDFTFTFHFHALEKEMATHSSVLAWRIPGMGEPGGLPSLGSHRVGHD